MEHEKAKAAIDNIGSLSVTHAKGAEHTASAICVVGALVAHLLYDINETLVAISKRQYK